MSAPLLGDWRDLGTVEEIARGVRAGLLDPLDLLERALRRAGAVDPLGAVVHLDLQGARDAARTVARTREGRLAGVPVLVKEIVAVGGLPFRCGSDLFADRLAEADAEVVRRARAAGAVIIGLAHSHEFAYGCTGVSNRAGPCRNPHDPGRMAGGSSSGSAAAVAAGVVPLALGTDTAGSIRIPAALCGVVGAKPARGTLPTEGVFPLSTTLDQVGVIAGSVADARFAVGVLAGIDARDGPVPRRPVIGVVQNPEPNDCAVEVADAYRRAVHRVAADAALVDVALPAWPELLATSLDIQGPEAAAIHAGTFPARADAYQPDVRERLRAAAEVPGWRYVRARERAVELTAEADRVLRTVDGVLLPTVPILPPPLDAREAEVSGRRSPVRELLLRNTRPLNVTGPPAVSIPLSGAELPVGLQVIAADDGLALALAEWLAARL